MSEFGFLYRHYCDASIRPVVPDDLHFHVMLYDVYRVHSVKRIGYFRYVIVSIIVTPIETDLPLNLFTTM